MNQFLIKKNVYDRKDRQRLKDRTILWPAIRAIIATALKRIAAALKREFPLRRKDHWSQNCAILESLTILAIIWKPGFSNHDNSPVYANQGN